MRQADCRGGLGGHRYKGPMCRQSTGEGRASTIPDLPVTPDVPLLSDRPLERCVCEERESCISRSTYIRPLRTQVPSMDSQPSLGHSAAAVVTAQRRS